MNPREELKVIGSVIGTRNPIPTRGRFPYVMLKALKILAPCHGHSKGIPIIEFTKRLYGLENVTTDDKIKARMIIRNIRKIFNLYIYSVNPIGIKNDRRYCHLQDPEDFKAVINDYEKKMKGGKKDGTGGLMGELTHLNKGKRKKQDISKLERILEIYEDRNSSDDED